MSEKFSRSPIINTQRHMVSGETGNKRFSFGWSVTVPVETSDAVLEELADALHDLVTTQDELVFYQNPKGILGSLIADKFSGHDMKPFLFTRYASEEYEQSLSSIEKYNFSEGHLESDHTFLDGTALHGKYMHYTRYGHLHHQGLYDHGHPIGLWEAPFEKDDDRQYLWYALDGSGKDPIASAARSRELIEQEAVREDLKKYGMEIIYTGNEKKDEYRLFSPALIDAWAPSLEMLLIDNDFLEDLEMAKKTEQPAANIFIPPNDLGM